jgi:putative hydrolase of the HAD superfamily
MLVLFDIDDTLIDHTSAVDSGVHALYAELGAASAPSVFREAWVAAMREHFPRYLRGELTYEEQRRARLRQTIDPHLSDADADDLFQHYFRAYRAAWSLFPDVLPCLAALSAHTLGIISNGNGIEQRAKLASTGIADRFQMMFISADCGHAKPDSEIFRLACRATCVQDAIYVGDVYEIDAIGARAAGLTGVWLDRQSSRGPDHVPPIIGGLSELPGLIHSRAV